MRLNYTFKEGIGKLELEENTYTKHKRNIRKKKEDYSRDI